MDFFCTNPTSAKSHANISTTNDNSELIQSELIMNGRSINDNTELIQSELILNGRSINDNTELIQSELILNRSINDNSYHQN